MHWLKMIYYGLLVANLAALHRNSNNGRTEKLVFGPLLLFAILIQLMGDWLKGNGYNHYFVFHIYVPVEYLLLCFYFRQIIQHAVLKLLIPLSGILFFAFYFFYFLLNKRAFFTPSFSQFVTGSILVTIWVLFFFIQLFQQEEKIELSRYPHFWINTGNLLFYSGCLFVMGFYFSVQKEDAPLAGQLLYINYLLNLLLYCMYLVAFTCTRSKKPPHGNR